MSDTFDVDQQRFLLEKSARLALNHAETLGVSGCAVRGSVSQQLAAGVLQQKVDTLTLSRDQLIEITVFDGHRRGNASISDTSDAAIKDAVERATTIARLTEEDPALGLADPALFATAEDDLALYHPWKLTPDEALEIALACENEGLSVPGILRSQGARLTTDSRVEVQANSAGFLQGRVSSEHLLSCGLIAADDAGMRQEVEYTLGRAPEALASPRFVGQQAAEKTLASRSPQTVRTGRYCVMFSPPIAKALINMVIRALSGGAQYKGASFLLNALGEPLMPDWFGLVERPHEKGGWASTYYDSDCVCTQNNTFIDQGCIASYLLSTYSGRRLGLPTTGNADGAHNLRVLAPAISAEEMLQRMGKGVLVTKMMGQGVNLVTGDYSRGAQGFWVEHGKIQYPIEGFTVAGNLKEMLGGLQAVGSDVDTRGGTHTGSWLIREMTVAG
ncbi:Metalloprotease PmbA [Halomonadaceae bacterium LMG 33818]|uniref:metallopeptidase TldD-related protein n=1 Tax=Cernens ardua TaxID=3402176 RepID=UPI003EDBF26B